MGLDVYVGTFTRYYQRDWQTIVQQSFPGEVRVVRADEGDQPAPEEVRAAVESWCGEMARSLKLPSIGTEDPKAPYFTDKPAWDGFGGLLLWAAYDDQGLDPAQRREAVTTENWTEDPALERYADFGINTRYPQLLLGEEMWLPIPSPSVFKSQDPAGNPRVFGNCRKLLDELDLINQRTWHADLATRDRWGRDGLEHGSPLEAAARFGWSLMHRLATQAVSHDLAIILDY